MSNVMMELQLFTVFDSAAGLYLEPFFAQSIEVALRSFREAANKPDHQFNKFPEDYTLFHIGSYDPEQGIVTGCPPRSLGVAITFLRRVEAE